MGDAPEDELERLAEDWITLWQSEIAGWMADPEAAELWAEGVAVWAAWLRAALAAAPAGAMRRGAGPAMAPFGFAAAREGRAERPPHDGAAAPPRAAAPAAASGPGDAARPGGGGHGADPERAALAARLAELERRLAALEGRAGGGEPDRRRPRRRRPSA
ncbi:hypothetical protein [Caldovatus aquaticus]|uniref:hypothetical protein n=1 Tax=Caldovatus aquaticus TaxID=2865671 RepID=UPI002105514C|nr:hypothetical protein [Caldovatus aquaticus]